MRPALPPAGRVQAAFRRAGIRKDSIMVGYGSANGIFAARRFHWKRRLDPRRRAYQRPQAEIAAAYRALGLAPRQEIVVYCQTLMRAAHSCFVLRMPGYPHARGYDGSWAEWGNRDDTPVATGRN